jgi:hypothetical protein
MKNPIRRRSAASPPRARAPSSSSRRRSARSGSWPARARARSSAPPARRSRRSWASGFRGWPAPGPARRRCASRAGHRRCRLGHPERLVSVMGGALQEGAGLQSNWCRRGLTGRERGVCHPSRHSRSCRRCAIGSRTAGGVPRNDDPGAYFWKDEGDPGRGGGSRRRRTWRRGAQLLVTLEPRFAPVVAAGPLPLRRRADGFAALLSAIVAQQVSTASAAAIWGGWRRPGWTGRRPGPGSGTT